MDKSKLKKAVFIILTIAIAALVLCTLMEIDIIEKGAEIL